MTFHPENTAEHVRRDVDGIEMPRPTTAQDIVLSLGLTLMAAGVATSTAILVVAIASASAEVAARISVLIFGLRSGGEQGTRRRRVWERAPARPRR